MKKNFKLMMLALAAMMTVTFTACDKNPQPEPEPEPEAAKYWYDVVVSIGTHGGMNQGEGTIVRRVSSLDPGQPMIDFNNKGVVLTGTYTMESIVKGKCYYQVPESADRFVKFEIVDNNTSPVEVASCPFVKNTYKQRNYTHAWIDDNTLVIMAANGDKDKILWTKLNAETMAIIAEGELPLALQNPQAKMFSTSGLLTYRKADNKLFYFHTEKKSARVAYPGLYTSVINPATMAVEGTSYTDELTEETVASAYGELLQQSVFYTEDGTMYVACLHATDVTPDGASKAVSVEDGDLLRIKPGQTSFDPTYNGYKNPEGKMLTIQYLGNNKALAYSTDGRIINPADPTVFLKGISDYIHFYSIIDLATGERTRLKYNGSDLPLSAGRFAQRSVVVNGKAYIGVSTETAANPCIYVYDIATGKVEKGVDISGGFYFDMIRVVDAE